ncbi:MAG: hypothetical protein M1832_002650 [Thelocarpon impressellum]|nr:MAG: hypothetical protein M1832_002650 [Thelocarpon impressellum]
MPKVLNYTPAWLSRPSPGFELFSSKTPASNTAGSKSTQGPRRTIARRGTEVFVAVGNQIRWADLSYLKNAWDDRAEKRRRRGHHKQYASLRDEADEEDDVEGAGFRHLKVSVSEPIRQLVASPSGNLLAILTSHTVHVAILPDPSHLTGPDSGPIRVKTHTLGPTTHVLAQSPVVSALWHPLGVSGNCLVTVTAEAVVRLWEVSAENRWSFDNPTLAVDLKKLADGTSADDDFAASTMGRNRGFSVDSVEMEVAAACFGGTNGGQEHGWSPMTLWLAMREGDVYALCPFLPSKWQPTPTLLPSLSVSIVSRFNSLKADGAASNHDIQTCKQQYAWISELDKQEPAYLAAASEFDPDVEVYTRPKTQGSLPRLQGPFLLDPMPEEGDDEVLLTDIYAVGAKLDDDELLYGEDGGSDFGGYGDDGLSLGVICLLTSSGRVHVCLDVDGVEGAWLPKKRSIIDAREDDVEGPSLLIFESLDTRRPDEVGEDHDWPVFSPDPHSRYSFFVTQSRVVTSFSLTTWIERLESELQSSGDAGLDFRLDVFSRGAGTLRQRVVERTVDLDAGDRAQELTASVVFRDSDLGYFLLTEAGGRPIAVEFDVPESESLPDEEFAGEREFQQEVKTLAVTKPRETYQPPESFWAPSPLSTFLDSRAQGRHRRSLTEEIKLSQSTLILMTEAHKVLSQHTHHLGVAAAELFRRCERLQEEFKDQIKRANGFADKVDDVLGDDEDDLDGTGREGGNAGIERRLAAALDRQEDLAGRYDALRRKLARRGGRELSDKEKAWVTEIDTIDSSISATTSERGKQPSPWSRYKEAKELASSLVSQAEEVTNGAEPEASTGFKVPPEIRKARVSQVMKLLDRESALVEATKDRLERLSLPSS